MIPVICRVSHDPANGTYGDCLRACIASILEKNAEEVPHFVHDDCELDELARRINEYLATQNLAPLFINFEASGLLQRYDDVLSFMGDNFPGHYFISNVDVGDGDYHVIIIRNGKIEHDPAWIRRSVKGSIQGRWVFLTFVPLMLCKP